MITVFHMETGEILECGTVASAAPNRGLVRRVLEERHAALALQEIPFEHRPVLRMPPDLAGLDIAKVLALCART